MKTILLIYLIFVVGFFLGTIKDFWNVAITPKEIYECNNFNMLAAVLLYIIMFIFNPLLFIFRFFYWIFHVGRED